MRVFDGDTILDRPERKWLIEGLIPERGVVLIFGKPKLGKSAIVLDMMKALTTGTAWANSFETAEPVSCLYLTSEGFDGLTSRVACLELNDESKPRYLLGDFAPELFKSTCLQDLKREVGERVSSLKGGLLVIDPLVGALGHASENDASDIARVMNQVKQIANDLDCAVILIHHENKKGGTDDQAIRGSSALHAAADVGIRVKTNGSVSLLEVAFAKDAPRGLQIAYELVERAVTIDERKYKSIVLNWSDGQVVLSSSMRKTVEAVKFLTDESQAMTTVGPVAELLGVSKPSASETLNKLAEKNVLERIELERYDELNLLDRKAAHYQLMK